MGRCGPPQRTADLSIGTNQRLIGGNIALQRKMIEIEKESSNLRSVTDQLKYEDELATLLRDFWVTGEQAELYLGTVNRLGERLPGNLDKALNGDAGIDALTDFLTIDCKRKTSRFHPRKRIKNSCFGVCSFYYGL